MPEFLGGEVGGFAIVPGSPCANMAGSATAYDPPSHRIKPRLLPTGPNCWKMTAPPVIITESYMSFMEGVNRMNADMHTNGYQPPFPTNVNLMAV
jgi:hypothetical protein